MLRDPRTCGCEEKPYREGMLLHSCKLCSSQALDYFKRTVDIPEGVWYNGIVDQVTGEVVISVQRDWLLSSVASVDAAVQSTALPAEREKGLY